MSSRHRLIALAVAASAAGLGALAGCAATQPASTGRADADFGLFVDENRDEGVKLAYGRANSDAVWLMLTCKPGTGRVEVIQTQGKDQDGPVSLSSGFQSTRLDGKAEAEDGPGDFMIRASANTSDAALAGFRASGRLSVAGPGYRYRIAATPAEREDVAHFFTRCGTA